MPNAFTLFGEIKVDTKQFTGALAKAETQLKGTTAAMTKAEAAAASTSKTAGGMSPKFLLVAAAAAAATAGIYGLIKKTSEFGSKIFDATQKTGLSAETLSALKYAAEESGSSFEQATKGITRFSLLMGEAASGSTKAADKLRELHVTSTDLTAGFSQAILAIAQMPPGIAQTMAASDAFGKKLGAELIPMIQSFDGNLPGLMDKLKGTGIIMSSEAAQASDKFGDALKRLEDQVGAIGRSFAVSLMPSISGAMEEIAKELAKDQPEYSKIGSSMGEAFGKALAAAAKAASASAGEESKASFLVAFAKDAGPLGSIGRGFLKELGFTPDFSGLYDALNTAGNKINQFTGRAIGSIVRFFGGIGPMIAGFAGGISGAAQSIGLAIGQGIINGIRAKAGEVAEAARSIAASAIAAAKSTLMVQSPSKVFYAIGQDTAQGFIDGLAATKATVGAKMAALFDVGNLKKLGKKDIAGVELLTGLIGEISKFNVVSKEQETRLEMTAGKYAKLNEQVKARILNAAREIDSLNLIKDGMAKLAEVWDKFVTSTLPEKTAVEQLNEAMAGKEIQAAFASMNKQLAERVKIMMQMTAAQTDYLNAGGGFGLGQGSGREPQGGEGGGLPSLTPQVFNDGAPPPQATWDNFWKMMHLQMDHFRQSLPSMKQAIGENLIGAIQGIGDVFGNAVSEWITTGKNFFQSIAAGFRKMVGDIIGELVRLLVYKFLMKLIMGNQGGGGGGSAGGGGFSGGLDAGGKAAGGYIRGPGSGTSDSIPAMLSNGEFVMTAKAVKKWGSGFFASLNSLQAPMAFAGGGMVGGGSISTFNQPINVYVQGGGSREQNQQTGNQIARAISENLRRNEARNK